MRPAQPRNAQLSTLPATAEKRLPVHFKGLQRCELNTGVNGPGKRQKRRPRQARASPAWRSRRRSCCLLCEVSEGGNLMRLRDDSSCDSHMLASVGAIGVGAGPRLAVRCCGLRAGGRRLTMAVRLQAQECSGNVPRDVAGGGGSSAVPGQGRAAEPEFSIVREEVVRARYLTLYNQAVQFPPLEGQAEVGERSSADSCADPRRVGERNTPLRLLAAQSLSLADGAQCPCSSLAPPCGRPSQGPVHEFDVVGHPRAEFHYAVVFPYHHADRSVTLVREYAQVGCPGGTSAATCRLGRARCACRSRERRRGGGMPCRD